MQSPLPVFFILVLAAPLIVKGSLLTGLLVLTQYNQAGQKMEVSQRDS